VTKGVGKKRAIRARLAAAASGLSDRQPNGINADRAQNWASASAEDVKAPSLIVLDEKAPPWSIPWRRPPQNGDAGSAQPVVNPQIWLDIDRVILLERNVDRR